MTELPPELEQQLADMSTQDWDAFVAKVRSPDNAAAFRDAASQWISGDRLDAICSIINTSLYVDGDGNIDAAKVERQLRAMFDDIPAPTAPHQDFGQHSPPPPQPGPGDGGRAAAAQRFNGKQAPTPMRGRNGLAEAQRRFKTEEQ
jgi:hypothetical protein